MCSPTINEDTNIRRFIAVALIVLALHPASVRADVPTIASAVVVPATTVTANTVTRNIDNTLKPKTETWTISAILSIWLNVNDVATRSIEPVARFAAPACSGQQLVSCAGQLFRNEPTIASYVALNAAPKIWASLEKVQDVEAATSTCSTLEGSTSCAETAGGASIVAALPSTISTLSSTLTTSPQKAKEETAQTVISSQLVNSAITGSGTFYSQRENWESYIEPQLQRRKEQIERAKQADCEAAGGTYSAGTCNYPPPPPPPVYRLYTHSGGNSYAPGNCTWGVKSWKPEVPNNLGDARNWGYALGYDSNPTVGAIAWTTAGYYGHVAVVIGIDGGQVQIQEENGLYGLGTVDTRWVWAGEFRYIHI